jgi:Lrp/AsnC family leucine-responsive transcriptional regulator
MAKLTVSLDEVDMRLLELLQEDASRTTKDLAALLHLTQTPVHERIKRLEREGFIMRYVALLNPQKLDKTLTAMCFISLKEHSQKVIKQFDRDIARLSEVLECYNIAGQFDYMLKIVVSDMTEYQAFMLKLAKLECIANVQTSFVLREIKHTTALALE